MSKLFINLKSQIQAAREDKGATAIEYILIVGGIAAVITVAMVAFGGEIRDGINNILP
jgi:Flp pilus assembly pilin Flp